MPRPALDGSFPGPLGSTYWTGSGLDEGMQRLIAKNEPLAVDIESEGLGELAYNIKSVQISTTTDCILLDPRVPEQRIRIAQIFTAAPSLVMHNSSFDATNMGVVGLFDKDIIGKVYDTMIYARLADSDTLLRKTLGDCAERVLGIPKGLGIEAAFRSLGLNKNEGYKEVDIDSVAYLRGAMDDALITAHLFPAIQARALKTLTEDHPYVQEGVQGPDAEYLLHREQTVNRVYLRRSIAGLRVDLDFADQFAEKNEKVIHRLSQELSEASVRPGVGQDLLQRLDREGLIPDDYPRTKKTNALSGTAEHLALIPHPLAQAHLQYKKLTKVRDDYLVKVRTLSAYDGRLHPQVGILQASATGRTSIKDPPLQQFPAGARGIILADRGDTLTSIDWASIEPVLLANIAGDIEPLKPFELEGRKFYHYIQTQTGTDEATAKKVVLAQLYGEGNKKLAADLTLATGKKWSANEAKDLSQKIFTSLPRSAQHLRTIKQCGDQYGKIITLSGRIVSIPRYEGQFAGYKAQNYRVQGSAWDLAAESIVAIDKAGLAEYLYLFMHDEHICSTTVADEIQRIMNTPPACLVKVANRVPVLRTDRKDMGIRWKKV